MTFAKMLRKLRNLLSTWRYRRRQRAKHPGYADRELGRFAALKDTRSGRAFLVGSAPSIAGMDLSPLADEFVCTVNMGLRGIGEGFPHVDMHVVFDPNRLARFGSNFEELAARHAIEYRFYKWNERPIWQALARPEPAEPFFVILDKRMHRGMHDVDPALGLKDGGSTAMIGAAQILFHFGFSEVYVIGCDLSHGEGQTYFYAMGEQDRVHESDPKVQVARAKMQEANDHFLEVRRLFERHGRRIANAGVGGNLTSLERVDFDTLFA